MSQKNIVALGRTKNELVKLFITVFLPLCFFFVPVNDSFTPQIRLFFVITLIAIISFATDSLPQMGVALSLPIIYVLTGLAPGQVAFAPWLGSIPWMMIGGLMLALVLEKTGLLKRIAFLCILATGASYKGIIWGITIAGVIINIMIPGKGVIPMAALSYGICKALDLKPGKASGGITLAAAMGSIMPILYLFAPGGIMIPLGIGASAGGPKTVGWLEIFTNNVPMVFYTVLMAFVVTLMFKPEKPISGKDYFQNELSAMGSMSFDEKKSLFVTLILITFLATGKLHGIDAGWGFAFIPCLFFLPGMDLVENKDLPKMNWGFIFFITACLSIGNVAGAMGIGKMIAAWALPLLEGRSFYVFYLFVWLLFFVMNFLMTPLAMLAAFTQPLTEIAISLNINPMTLYYVILNGADQILLPYEYALYLIFFSFGMVRVSDFAKLMSVKVVVNFALVFGLLIPYWNLIGLIPMP